MKIILLFYLSCVIVSLTTGTNYCNPELCKKYNGIGYDYLTHIACGNTGNFDSICSKDAYIVPLTQQHKDLILNIHNSLRNTIASGSLPRFSSAKRMPTVIWNDELSEIAELNTKRCQLKHDVCRNTDKFTRSGQNLAMRSWHGLTISDLENIEYLVKGWFAEYTDSNQSDVDIYHSQPPGAKQIGHFTLMIHEKVTELGCAISRFSGVSSTTGKPSSVFYLACNYGFNNFIGEPIYRKGIPCSECLTGCVGPYPALCTVEENDLISAKPNNRKIHHKIKN